MHNHGHIASRFTAHCWQMPTANRRSLRLRSGPAPPLGLKRVCEYCAVPQPPQRAQKRRSLGTPVRDSDLFPTSPSTPPSAPCWAKLFRAYGAGFSASKFHWQIPSFVLTHALQAGVKATFCSNFSAAVVIENDHSGGSDLLIRVERGAKAQLYPGLRSQWF